MKTHPPLLTPVTRALLLLAAIIVIPACVPPGESKVGPQPLSAQQMENLVAFTRLYGYVRFFHPSDEAAQIDWDKFAIYGSMKMLKCSDQGDLVTALTQLYAPIAPSALIYSTRNPPGAGVRKSLQLDTSRLKMVAWQHLGVGLSSQSAYRSVRFNRKNINAGGNSKGFGVIAQSLEASNLRGKGITLRAAVKVDQGSRGQLWVRVDLPGGKVGFFDNMDDRPVLSTDWKYCEIAGKVDSSAVQIVFGCMLIGTGKVWLDDVHILSGEPNQQGEIKLPNSDFEKDSIGTMPERWNGMSPGYAVEVTNETASAGAKSVRIRSMLTEQPSELFPERPDSTYVFSRNLPGGISCEIPVVLLADSASTLPRGDRKALDELNRLMNEALPKSLSGNEQSVRLADIIIAWNVFQHFYPYFDVVPCNWEQELPIALQEAWRASNEITFSRTLQKFIAKLHDGHGNVTLASDSSTSYLPPFRWAWIENSLVITAIYDSSGVMPAVGDIVLEIEGRPARSVIKEEEAFTSAAHAERRTLRAVVALLGGPANSKMNLKTRNWEGQESTHEIRRALPWRQYYTIERQRRRPTGRIADDIFYINLSISPMSVIDSLMPQLTKARGIICDVRGRPDNNHEFISHLLGAPDTSAHWMAIPKTIYPDRQKPAGFEYHGWKIQPKEPRIQGKMVFLTNSHAISYAEAYMSLIEHYKLAEIVGEPTAGTSGDVNPLMLPGGYQLVWTGMKVTKQDGSRFHGVGIQPTLPVHQTIRGIREGRDEQLEAAVELINGTSQ